MTAKVVRLTWTTEKQNDAIDNRRSLIYIANLVAAIIVCIDHAAGVLRIVMIDKVRAGAAESAVRKVGSPLNASARQPELLGTIYENFGKIRVDV